MAATYLDTVPVPRDTEARSDFIARFIASSNLKHLTLPRRHKLCAEAWEAARLRSRVSIRNGAGEFLCFD